MTDKRVKVLFICGNGRSGSTILDIILGQIDGFFAVGELRRIWDRSVIDNRPCGCGVPFSQCPTWQAIFREAYGGADKIDPHLLAGLRDRCTLTKHLTGMWADPDHTKPVSAEVQTYLDHLDKIYRAIDRVSRPRVIVDASKWPMYAYMLEKLPAVDLYILHLVRDPRAVAHSWTREKEFEPGTLHPRQSAARSTAYWVTWNPAIERFWKHNQGRYLLMRYEDFVQAPREWIRRIVQLTGEGELALPFTDEKTAVLKPTHAVAGNIARLTQGPVKIRPDEEWKQKASPLRSLIVTALGWPLMARYGYLGGKPS